MPSSGPMIEASIKKLGFKPEDIKYIITSHAHIDHVGGRAYMKKITGAEIVMIDAEKELFESGGKIYFHYGLYPEFLFEPLKVDEVIKHGDALRRRDITMIAIHTPGHTKGSTSWLFNITDNGKTYLVVCPDGSSISHGYRVEVDPSYEGIGNNYIKTLDILSALKPDIWLSSHTDYFDFEKKSKLSEKEGVNAWTDPEGYKKRIEGERKKLEKKIKLVKSSKK